MSTARSLPPRRRKASAAKWARPRVPVASATASPAVSRKITAPQHSRNRVARFACLQSLHAHAIRGNLRAAQRRECPLLMGLEGDVVRVVVTGGAGFIGSHVCELLSARGDEVVCFDNLTYAGSLDNLERLRSSRNFAFTKADITDAPMVRTAIRGADAVINCAAETHVDRSLLTPARFAHTDAYGAAILLEEARVARVGVVLQVSTDEVYGPIADGEATEDRALRGSLQPLLTARIKTQSASSPPARHLASRSW